MTEPMTLEEAVRVLHDVRNVVRANGTVDRDLLNRAEDAVFAHAERTVEARSVEPEEVRAFRDPNTRSWSHAEVVCQHIDRLTAANEFARREWAIWEAKACQLQARIDEVEAERDAVREKKLAQLRALRAEQESARLREDRDRLAACVERVVLACRNSFDVRARGKCPDCGELVDQTTQAVGLVRAGDILAATGEEG